MTKEQFVYKFEVLQAHDKEAVEIGRDLGRLLCDGYAVIKYGGALQDNYIQLLAELSGIDEDLISGLLYEGGGMHYYGVNDEIKFNVITAEDLWDFNELCNRYDDNANSVEV